MYDGVFEVLQWLLFLSAVPPVQLLTGWWYEYREQKIAAGFTRLADVPADDIDGESIKVFYYERAVCAMATASLYERYRGVDASAKGDKKADSIDSTIDELWRDMRWAVARIQDKPRCIVSQI